MPPTVVWSRRSPPVVFLAIPSPSSVHNSSLILHPFPYVAAAVKRWTERGSNFHYGHNPCGRDEARPSKTSGNGCFQSWRDDLRGVRCSCVAIMRRDLLPGACLVPVAAHSAPPTKKKKKSLFACSLISRLITRQMGSASHIAWVVMQNTGPNIQQSSVSE